MASRASNFCIDAHDPYAQTMWWAKVLEDFTVDVGAKLSPEALQNFQKLPTETQAQIAKAVDVALQTPRWVFLQVLTELRELCSEMVSVPVMWIL